VGLTNLIGVKYEIFNAVGVQYVNYNGNGIFYSYNNLYKDVTNFYKVKLKLKSYNFIRKL